MISLFKTTLLAIALISTNAFAENKISKVILTDETVISGNEISQVNINPVDKQIDTIELKDNSVIDSTDIKSMILKNVSANKSFLKSYQMSERIKVSGGDGSGG
jgi:hypothetical protein